MATYYAGRTRRCQSRECKSRQFIFQGRSQDTTLPSDDTMPEVGQISRALGVNLRLTKLSALLLEDMNTGSKVQTVVHFACICSHRAFSGLQYWAVSYPIDCISLPLRAIYAVFTAFRISTLTAQPPGPCLFAKSSANVMLLWHPTAQLQPTLRTDSSAATPST